MRPIAYLLAVAALALGGRAASAASAASAAELIASPEQIAAGEAVYARCLACHALAYDRTGPRHCGLFGRRAGSVPGFDYSPAMKRSGIVWNEKTLERFIANPGLTVPGTNMGYAGVKDKKERADLIAYLKQANQTPECGRQP
jgi:cytochrome c